MIKFARDFRLIPIVLIATISLFALKVGSLILGSGSTFAERMQDHYKPTISVTANEKVPAYPKIVVADRAAAPAAPANKGSWAAQMFNYDGDGGDITGAISKKSDNSGPPLKMSQKPPGPPTLRAGNTSITITPGTAATAGERALLKSLKGRRQELDRRSRLIDMRENLLKATEKRVEAKVAELKVIEAQIKAAMGARDKQQQKRFKSLVSMYQSMGSKDAARIFDRLDFNILIEVATAMKPRKMSEILAQMAPARAEQLTVELAQRASAVRPQTADKLPKIQGTPNGT